jgi:DnaJ family protein C protein 28
MPNIEELMRKAMQEGKFKDLPGKGKPLNLGDDNPHADPEWELAYKMLKDSGYSLPWIETLHEIETELAAARKDLHLAWQWYQAGKNNGQSPGEVSAQWKRAQQAFREKLTGLNKRIRDYNLQVPQARFQRPALNIEQELQATLEEKS